jgi:hypothetical protein
MKSKACLVKMEIASSRSTADSRIRCRIFGSKCKVWQYIRSQGAFIATMPLSASRRLLRRQEQCGVAELVPVVAVADCFVVGLLGEFTSGDGLDEQQV